MKRDLWTYCLGVVAALAFLCLVPSGARGQAAHKMTPEEYAAKQAAIRKAAAEQPTPRMPDGHPDLSGVWGSQGPGGAVTTDEQGGRHVIFPTRVAPKSEDPDGISVYYNQQADGDARRAADKNKPPYKEELMAKVKQLDRDSNQLEPFCVPSPRAFPTQIFATPSYVVFLFGGEGSSHYRLIPTDGSAHPKGAFSTYMGDSVGHWEGDTLVIDVTNYNDKAWLGSAGWFHSDALHVVERFTRHGNILHYEATVEDPVVFTRPWVQNPRDIMVVPDAKYVYEDLPCVDKDRAHFVNHDHV